jgi:hypothetical protein
MDFFTAPTITFHDCFFLISHDRRRILHFNVCRYPASTWIVQQLREAFGEGLASFGYRLCDFLKSGSFPCRPAGRIVVLNYRSGMGVVLH